MAGTDHYRALGVPRTASGDAIRRAYLVLVQRLHPDRVGPEGTARFQEIVAAYDTLSDPSRRAHYDRSLQFETPLTVRRRAPEPLVPEPISILGDPEPVRPSFEEAYDRFARNFTGSVPKSEHLEAFDIGVILTPREAAEGAHLTFSIPVVRECPACGGVGGTIFPCVLCRMRGLVRREEVVHARIPPMIRHGTVVEVPLERIGIQNFYLRIHVAVRASPALW